MAWRLAKVSAIKPNSLVMSTQAATGSRHATTDLRGLHSSSCWDSGGVSPAGITGGTVVSQGDVCLLTDPDGYAVRVAADAALL